MKSCPTPTPNQGLFGAGLRPSCGRPGTCRPQTPLTSFPHNTHWPCPSDSSAYLCPERGQFGADVADVSFKTWKVTTASVNPGPLCLPPLPSIPIHSRGRGLGFGPVGVECLQGHLPWVSAASCRRCSWLHCKSVPGGLLVSCRSCLGLGKERCGVLPSGWSPLGTVLTTSL